MLLRFAQPVRSLSTSTSTVSSSLKRSTLAAFASAFTVVSLGAKMALSSKAGSQHELDPEKFYSLTANHLSSDKGKFNFDELKGSTVLVVNVASA